jgi:YVTN family beta-propeller protein
VFVTNTNLNTVSVINTSTSTVTDVPVGAAPYGVAVSLDSTRAYVTNSGANEVAVIDVASNAVIASIPVGLNPRGIVVSPEGTLAYVANADSNTISVIDVATNTVTATIHASAGAPLALAITDRRVYVTSLRGQVVTIDRGAEAVIATSRSRRSSGSRSPGAWP